MKIRCAVVLLCLVATADAAAARTLTEKERLRQQAQHLCYDDVQSLCADAVENEAATTACMKAHRAQLSPACRKVFEAGLR